MQRRRRLMKVKLSGDTVEEQMLRNFFFFTFFFLIISPIFLNKNSFSYLFSLSFGLLYNKTQQF